MWRPGRRPLATLWCLILSSLLLVTGCGAFTPSRNLTGFEKTASELAADVIDAKTVENTRAGVMQILEALRVGVWRNDGTPEMRGAERAAGDGYLYSDEASALASAFAGGQRTSIVGFANSLRALGLLEFEQDEQTPDAERVASAIQAGIATAVEEPTKESSLVRLLIRELGLQRQKAWDPAAGVPLELAVLDPLQQWLLIAEHSLATLAETGPVSSAGLDERRSTVAAASTAAGKPYIPPKPTASRVCDFGADGRALWPMSKWLVAAVVPLIAPNTVAATARAVIALDALHMVAAMLMITVEPVKENAGYTHYGHDGDTGRPLDLQVRVRMIADLGAVAECSWIAYYDVPAVGPIPGVTVQFADGQGQIGRHGVLACTDGCVTDARGIATARFTPKTEVTPAGPQQDDDTGTIFATALYQTKVDNLPGRLLERAVPSGAHVRWGVEWHDPGLTVHYTVRVRQDMSWNSKSEFWDDKSVGAADVTLTAEVALTHDGDLVNLSDLGDKDVTLTGSGPITVTSADWNSARIYRGKPVDDSDWCGHQAAASIVDTHAGTINIPKLELKRGADGNLLPGVLQFDLWEDPPGLVIETKYTITEGRCPWPASRIEQESQTVSDIQFAHDPTGITRESFETKGWKLGKPDSGVIATLTHNTTMAREGGAPTLVEEEWEIRD